LLSEQGFHKAWQIGWLHKDFKRDVLRQAMNSLLKMLRGYDTFPVVVAGMYPWLWRLKYLKCFRVEGNEP